MVCYDEYMNETPLAKHLARKAARAASDAAFATAAKEFAFEQMMYECGPVDDDADLDAIW
jgi:hypothetical protein